MASFRCTVGGKQGAAQEKPRPAIGTTHSALLGTWTHPEWGPHEIYEKLAGPQDDFDWLYWDMITALIRKHWLALAGKDVPRMKFCEMWKPGEFGTWGPMQAVAVYTMGKGPQWMKVSAAIRKTRTMTMSDGQWGYVSPFVEWGLADYWEGGWYDK